MNLQGCSSEAGQTAFGVVGLIVTVEKTNMCMKGYLAIAGLEMELVTRQSDLKSIGSHRLRSDSKRCADKDKYHVLLAEPLQKGLTPSSTF